MEKKQLTEFIKQGQLDEKIAYLMGKEKVESQKERYLRIIEKADVLYKANEYHIFSAPGRSEIGGNHTDHQNGHVLAASVNVDIICVACENDDYVEVYSEGFDIKPIAINDLNPRKEEEHTTEALIRGTLYRFKELGYNIGGFKGYFDSEVLKGSGISSSAAYEVLIGTVLSHLYNDGKISPIEIAKIGQFAENVHFNKPCGLMDQMACSVGGFVAIDFKDVNNPIVINVNRNFSDYNHHLVLVDTKGDHADLSDEYGYMRSEMNDVAKFFNKEVLSELTLDEVLKNVKAIRETTSDRALLRAIHFFNEDKRAVAEKEALENNDFELFKQIVLDSGDSSYKFLQNVYSTKNISEQNISVGLALSEQILKDKGAYRVHGGGLAGTIQAIVPDELLVDYLTLLDSCFGEGSAMVMNIRPEGGVKLV